VFGISQQLRGAQLRSHALWSLMISGTVAGLLYPAMFPPAQAGTFRPEGRA